MARQARAQIPALPLTGDVTWARPLPLRPPGARVGPEGASRTVMGQEGKRRQRGGHCPLPALPWRVTHLFSCTSWMFSMPMALLRREPNGPDFFLVGLFPGTIRDCRERPQFSTQLPWEPLCPPLPHPKAAVMSKKGGEVAFGQPSRLAARRGVPSRAALDLSVGEGPGQGVGAATPGWERTRSGPQNDRQASPLGSEGLAV